jgi:hypothetical protein
MNPWLLCFSPDGQGHCLYSEVIDLSAIGCLEMRRVSLIEFNCTKQEWEVKDMEGNRLFSHQSRNACLAWEQIHILPCACLTTRHIDHRKHEAHA